MNGTLHIAGPSEPSPDGGFCQRCSQCGQLLRQATYPSTWPAPFEESGHPYPVGCYIVTQETPTLRWQAMYLGPNDDTFTPCQKS